MQNRQADVYCDGSYRTIFNGLLGTVCIGIYILYPDGNDVKVSKVWGYGPTSNFSELVAVKHSLKLIEYLGIQDARIFSDSKCTVEYMCNSMPRHVSLEYASRDTEGLRQAHKLAKQQTDILFNKPKKGSRTNGR